MKEQDLQEQFDRYFAGDLSKAEQHQLETEIEGDPLVKAEFNWQKSLIEGIRDFRYAELKSRLASIPVSMVPVNLWVSASSAVVIGGISGLIYYNVSTQEDLTSDVQEDPLKTEVVEGQPPLVDPNAAEYPVSNHEVKEKEEMAFTEEKASTPSKTLRANQEGKQPERNAQEEKIQEADLASQEPSVDFQKPVLPAGDEGSIRNAGEEGAVKKLDKSTSPPLLDVEIKKDPAYNFHYKYSNHKLFLYGALNEEPYRLLELEQDGGNRLYLAYQGEYYLLSSNTLEPTPLRPIKDRKLKKSLKDLEENSRR